MILSPFEQIKQSFDSNIPNDLLDILPKKWEKIGDVLILKLPKKLVKYQEIIGKKYAEILFCKSVLHDRGGIQSELRIPVVKLIYGSKNTETKHIENGITFNIDPQKIMFSSGNLNERVRMATISNEKEIIVDMFAGIGYFSLPIAVYSKPKKIYSCELNPISYSYLKQNINENHVEAIIEPLNGDSKLIAPDNIAQRIVMGYFHNTIDFFMKAINCLENQKGMIHYHDTIPEKKIPDNPLINLNVIARQFNRRIIPVHIQKVKSFAPGINHYVFDLEVK